VKLRVRARVKKRGPRKEGESKDQEKFSSAAPSEVTTEPLVLRG
jgi:hypothetical protein